MYCMSYQTSSSPLNTLLGSQWHCILAGVCTICLLSRVKANRSSSPKRDCDTIKGKTFTKLRMQSIIWLYVMGLFVLLQKVDNVIFVRHFLCNELMNLEEEDASVRENLILFFFFFYHSAQCSDLIPVLFLSGDVTSRLSCGSVWHHTAEPYSELCPEWHFFMC